MTGVTVEEKGIGRQMWDLLERKPEKYDVVFSVGVTKVKVQAVKFILEAASSVFEEEFEEKWETAAKDGEGIPLVDVDPVAFQLFVKLVTLDTWSVEVLKALDLSPNTFFNLLSICRRFQVTKAIKNLEVAAEEFVRSFDEYNATDEFLEMSPQTKFDGSTLCLTKNRKTVDNPVFVCNGDQSCNWFKISNGRISLHGIGFFGPIDGDSYFDVTVQIIRRNKDSSLVYNSGEKKKRIFGRKRQTFHFMFDEPITIKQSDGASNWNDEDEDHYTVWCWLKGPNLMAVDRKKGHQEALEQNGVKFRFLWSYASNQFAEFLYKKL